MAIGRSVQQKKNETVSIDPDAEKGERQAANDLRNSSDVILETPPVIDDNENQKKGGMGWIIAFFIFVLSTCGIGYVYKRTLMRYMSGCGWL